MSHVAGHTSQMKSFATYELRLVKLHVILWITKATEALRNPQTLKFQSPTPARSALALVAVLEVAGDLRQHQLSFFAIQIRDPIEKLARLLAFQDHDLFGMPED